MLIFAPLRWKVYHARSVLPEGSLLVANEVIRNRSQVLAENLAKWGTSGCGGYQ